MWKIPLFDLNYNDKEARAAARVMKSKWLTMGQETRAFEEQFSNYLGKGVQSVAVSSCTAALHLSLMAIGLKRDDEVILSGLTFVACLNVVTLVGARPVLADSLSFRDWNVSAKDIEAKITPKTRAVIIVHYAGYPCDMDKIAALCRKHKLVLIEDTAHAVGAEYRGKKCGTIGDIGCFSFYSNKNLSTGEGGMIVTRNPELFEKFKLLRSHGMTSMTLERHNKKVISYDVVIPGLNYRIDEIRSALGVEQLKKLDAGNRRRKALVAAYHNELKGLREVIVPWSVMPKHKLSSYHIFTVLLPARADRKAIIEQLKGKGIQTSIHYPAFDHFSYYQNKLRERLPVAGEISQRVLTLPLYPTMKISDVKLVVRELRNALTLCS